VGIPPLLLRYRRFWRRRAHSFVSNHWVYSKQAGFNLYELMITLVIIGALTTAAVGMQGLIQDSRLVAQVNQLVGYLHLVRSEAIKRGTTVTICKSANGINCTPSSTWHEGWIIFADPNRNRAVDSGEAIIRAQQALTEGNTVKFRASLGQNNDVTYRPSGFSEKNGTFTFCDTRGPSKARAIILYRTGRPRVSTKSSSGDPLNCS